MPLQGNLKEMSLANLIQVNCQEMRSARLALEHAGQHGEVYFSDGQVVHGLAGNLIGEAAIYAMLSWDTGTFVLDRDQPSPTKTIDLKWNVLLLEGMKRAAEKSAAPRKSEVAMKPDTLAQLKAIDGVSGVVISASDGIVLGADVPDSDGEKEAAVAVFIGGAAQQIGETLALDTFSHGLVTLKDRRWVVLQMPDRFVGLLISGERTSSTIVANSAKEILRK